MEVTLTSKCQMTLPAEFRRRFGLKPGDKLLFEEAEDGRFLVSPKPRKTGSLADAFGSVPWNGPTVTVEEMDEAIADAVVERYLRAVEPDE